jgi:hypothetical protein
MVDERVESSIDLKGRKGERSKDEMVDERVERSKDEK